MAQNRLRGSGTLFRAQPQLKPSLWSPQCSDLDGHEPPYLQPMSPLTYLTPWDSWRRLRGSGHVPTSGSPGSGAPPYVLSTVVCTSLQPLWTLSWGTWGTFPAQQSPDQLPKDRVSDTEVSFWPASPMPALPAPPSSSATDAAAAVPLPPHASPGRPARLPADVICLAGVLQIQTVGLLPLLVGAHGHDGLPPPLGAGDVPAGAEEHPVAVLGRHLVEELPQGLVALAPVADLVGHAGGARGDVGGPVLLAGVVQVAGLGGVQAVVPFGDVLHCKGRERKAGVSAVRGARLRSALTKAPPGLSGIPLH